MLWYIKKILLLFLWMPNVDSQFWEITKTILPWLTGGVMGAVVTALITLKRNKIQPIARKLFVSYVDLPEVMQSYSALITIKSQQEGLEKSYHFQKLAIVQIELTNKGNKDIEAFDLGVNLPKDSKIIGIRSAGEDRYHTVSYSPKITIDHPANHVDFVLKPFNRKESYKITLISDTTEHDILGKIKLSKKLPVKFIDENVGREFDYGWRSIRILNIVLIILLMLFVIFLFFEKIFH